MRVLTNDVDGAAGFLSACSVAGWRDELVDARELALAAALGVRGMFSTDVHGAGAFWTTLTVVSETRGSQFTALDQLLRTGARLPGPVALVARSGRHFRGQRDREWIGAAGNLHLSVALPLDMRIRDAGAGLPMLPAVAVLDAVLAATGGMIRPSIKWVNDILIGEHKLAGVLTAAHMNGDRFDNVIWGIGVNLAIPPAVAATPFVPASVCLHEVRGGDHVTLPALLWAVLAAIEARVAQLRQQGVSPLFDAYRASSMIVGRPVKVWDEMDCRKADPARWGEPLAQGQVTAIDEDLGLHVAGYGEVIRKGRLAVCGGAPPAATVRPRVPSMEPAHA